jgi:hypothetical protein
VVQKKKPYQCVKHGCNGGTKAEIVDSVERIDREWLDSVANDFCYTYGWFKIVEALRTRFEMEPRYLTVHEENRIVAFTPVFLTPDFPYFSVENRNSLIKTMVNLGNHMGFHLNHGRTLVCDPPNCLHSRIMQEENRETKDVFNLISAKIDEVCREERIPVSCFNAVPEFDELLADKLQDFGYFRASTRNHLYLDIPWSSFDEYLNSLEHKVSRNVKREIKKCEEAGILIEEEKNFENDAVTLSNLSANTFSKYNKDRESPVDSSYFTALSKYAKDDARVFVAKKNERIIGFSLCFRKKDIIDVSMVGFDYDSLTKTDFAYFNVTYYVPVKWAIDKGIRRAYYRFGTEEAKLKRGCKIEKLHTFLKLHNRLLRPLVTPYVRRTIS